MKKMFAASLVAIMAVSAANAEIASVSYTDKAITAKTGDISTLATNAKSNLTAAVNELAGKVGTQDVGAQVSGALTEAKGYTDTEVKKLAEGAVATNTAAIAALDNTYATDEALADGLALKEDAANKTTSFDDTTASDVKFPSTSAVKSYVSSAVSTLNTDLGAVQTALAGKQATIDDLDTIRSGAAAGAVAEANANLYTDQEVNNLSDSLDGSYVSETEMTAFKTANTAAIETAKTGAIEAAAEAAKIYIDESELTASQNAQNASIKELYEAADATTLSSAKTYAKEYADGLAVNYATAAQGAKADSAVQKADVTTGTTNGTIKVQGQEVSVAGLGTAAYTASTAYATAAQGAKADSAMQETALKGLASWTSAGCATGTCSLVSKSGTIQWEAVKYAE